MATIVNERPVIDAEGSPIPDLAASFAALDESIDRTCAELDALHERNAALREEKRRLVQLVQEALAAFEDPNGSIDLRDWVKSAKLVLGARS